MDRGGAIPSRRPRPAAVPRLRFVFGYYITTTVAPTGTRS